MFQLFRRHRSTRSGLLRDSWHLDSCRVKQGAFVSKRMCACAGVWPMWCSDVPISLSLALFLNSLSPGVLKLPDGKFFLGNSYTSYFSFLSHFIFDSVLLIFAVIWMSGKTLIWWSAIILFVIFEHQVIVTFSRSGVAPLFAHFRVFEGLKCFLKVFHSLYIYLLYVLPLWLAKFWLTGSIHGDWCEFTCECIFNIFDTIVNLSSTCAGKY